MVTPDPVPWVCRRLWFATLEHYQQGGREVTQAKERVSAQPCRYLSPGVLVQSRLRHSLGVVYLPAEQGY